MEQTPNLSIRFHLRMTIMMISLLLTDIGMLLYSIDYTMKRGPSMMIIFGFEVRLMNLFFFFLVLCIIIISIS